MAHPSVSSTILQSIETDAQKLTVEKLKIVLRASSLPVSGAKGILIQRIRDELRKLSQESNRQRFDRLRLLIQNPDKTPPARLSSSSPAHISSPYDLSPRFGSQINGRSFHAGISAGSSHWHTESRTDLSFTESPFYQVIEKVSPRMDLESRETSRDSKDFHFKLRSDLIDQLSREKNSRVLLYCANDDALRGNGHIAFPNSFELKLNGQEVRGNFRGLKNKPGTTRPVDVTSLVHRSSHIDNRVSVTWALTGRKYMLQFQFVRQVDPSDLVRKLRKAKSISKASVLKEMNSWADDSDIVATSSRMSLKCPLSTLRIQTPCRSKRCKHNQCFDALSFLQLQEQAPQWSCPVCNQHVPFDILQVDEYVDDVLKNSPHSVEQVVVQPDGHWSLVSEKGKADSPTETNVKREDTELSDDIIEISQTPRSNNTFNMSTASFSPHVNSLLNGSVEPSRANSGHHTPQKRPAPAVIDLTGDSDDDEDDDLPVIPPAKRQQLHYSGSQLGEQHSQPPGNYSNRISFPLPRQHGGPMHNF